MAYCEAQGKIAHPALTLLFLQFGDGFNVILSQFGRMVTASTLMAFRMRDVLLHCSIQAIVAGLERGNSDRSIVNAEPGRSVRDRR